MAQVSYLFIDTNILLHFRPIIEIPWHDFVQGDQIVLIITRGVVRDLDKHKNINPSDKIRSRARRVLKEIEEWAKNSNGSEIRPKVIVAVSYNLPTIDFRAFNLDQDWSDDYLLSLIKSFQLDSKETSVWIVSDDTAIRIKAQHIAIPPLVLDEIYRLPSEVDPLELENEQLRQKVLKLSVPATPELKIEFSDSKDFIRFSIPPVPKQQELEKDISAKIEATKTKHPPYAEDRFLGARMAFAAPATHEIERYNAALPKYYAEYEAFLRQSALNDIRGSLTFEFNLQLRNMGKAPADDIDIRIHFPDGMSFHGEDRPTNLARDPEPPPPPKSEFQLANEKLMISIAPEMFPSFGESAFRKPEIVAPAPNVSSARIKKTNSYEVSFTVKRVKHGFVESLGSLAFFFDRLQDVQSFEADYIVNAANMPEDSKGKIRFAFVSSEAP